MSSFDPRPRTMACALTGRQAPDVFNANLDVPKGMDDPDFVQAVRHLDEGWVFLRAVRVVPHPDVENAIGQQIEQARAAGEAQGWTEEMIEATITAIEDNAPEAYALEFSQVVVSPEQVDALLALGIVFEGDEDGDENEFADVLDLGAR